MLFKFGAQKAGKEDIKGLVKRNEKSHKGENGVVLIVAGSAQYHGAAIFAGVTASRIVDLVYFATSEENKMHVKNASPEFIVLEFNNISSALPKADAVLIGPGLEQSQKIRNLVNSLLTKNKGKRFVLDATALRLIDPRWLHPNCIVTPHPNEFRQLFKMVPSKENAIRAAQKFGCVVVLKGRTDYISDRKQHAEISGGSPMLTTGGTGDILAGLIAGFAAKNPLFLAAKAGCFLNKYAGDLLQKEKGGMWNAQDLMNKLPEAKKKIEES